MPDDTSLIGYADDIAAVIVARNKDEAQMKLNMVMRRVGQWLEDHGLELAAEKIELVFLRRKQKKTFDNIQTMYVGRKRIKTKEAIKYLGITLDRKMTFGEHIKKAADKAAVVTGRLSRLMANIGGPSASKRCLLMTVTHSVLLYGAEIWGDALELET